MLSGPTLPLDAVATNFSAVMVASGVVVALSLAFIAIVMLTRRSRTYGELFHLGTHGSDQRRAA